MPQTDPPKPSMTDAELKAELERLEGELKPLDSWTVEKKRKALREERDKLEKERDHRAREALRAMSDAEVIAAANPQLVPQQREQAIEQAVTDWWFVNLAKEEFSRRKTLNLRRSNAQQRPRFDAMTDDELMQFAANPGGANEAEIQAAISVVNKRRALLGKTWDELTKALRAVNVRNLRQRDQARIAPPTEEGE